MTENAMEIANPKSSKDVGIGTSINMIIVIIPKANITSELKNDRAPLPKLADVNPPPPEAGDTRVVVGKLLAIKTRDG
jgi:hypothetical protein